MGGTLLEDDTLREAKCLLEENTLIEDDTLLEVKPLLEVESKCLQSVVCSSVLCAFSWRSGWNGREALLIKGLV